MKATDDNKYAGRHGHGGESPALGLGYAFIKGSLLPGTAAANAAVIVLGELTRFEPASDSDDPKVAQVVALWR